MARSSKTGDIFKRSHRAVETAFQSTAKRLGLETSPDMLTYETLAPEDFNDLSKLYGQESVLEYIREMEKKRLLP